MKTKKLSKKLALNKMSIAALNVKDLVSVKGGEFSVTEQSCDCTHPIGSYCCTIDTVCSYWICP